MRHLGPFPLPIISRSVCPSLVVTSSYCCHPSLMSSNHCLTLIHGSFQCSQCRLLSSSYVTLTHNRLTAVVRDYPGRPVPEETPTHSHPLDILYQLPPFTTIHSILCVQFTCLTVFFDNLPPGPLWSSSWSWTLYFILHAFLYPHIFFSQHMPTQPVLL